MGKYKIYQKNNELPKYQTAGEAKCPVGYYRHSILGCIPIPKVESKTEQAQLASSNKVIVKDSNYGKKVDPYVDIIDKETKAKQLQRRKDVLGRAGVSAGVAATIVTGGLLAPYIGPALAAPIAGVQGLTAGNLINAGFAYQGAKNIPNVLNSAKSAYDNPTLETITNATAETALTVLDMLPFTHTATNGIKSVAGELAGKFSKSKYTVDPSLNGSIVPNISQHNIKNLEDLQYAKEWGKKYGYSLPENLERIAQSDKLTDMTVKGLANRNNTFVRGVSTNWAELEARNPEILRHLEGKGIDWQNNPKAAAEYMATHIPINTGYGRVSLNENVFKKGMDGLYTSNSIPTAEGYTYGDGFIVKAKKPTDFSSPNRKDWINNNSVKYFDENVIEQLSPASLNIIKMENNAENGLKNIQSRLDDLYEQKIIHKNNPNYSHSSADQHISKYLKDIELIKKHGDDLFKDQSNFDMLKTEHSLRVNNIENIGEALKRYNTKTGKGISSIEEKLANIASQARQVDKKTTNEIIKLQEDYLKTIYPGFERKLIESEKYAHYIHLGIPGQKILEPISSQRITPEIWKNKSRAHTNKYSKGLSAASILTPIAGAGLLNEYQNGGEINKNLPKNKKNMANYNNMPIFQDGGETQDNFFNNYLDLLENASEQVDEEPMQQEPVQYEEGDDFIGNLQAYDEEQTALSKQEMQEQVFNQYLAKIDERLSYMDAYAEDVNLFEDMDETQLTNNYDTRTNATPFFNRQSAGAGAFSGIFRNEGAKTGQPTNLNSSAIGRGQMIKGTRQLMYTKLGIPRADFAEAEQKFKTDPDFEMSVMNAYREDLSKKIPSNITGQQREYMIAKGWYTGDVNYPDDVVPGKSAGNRITAGEYARRAVGIK